MYATERVTDDAVEPVRNMTISSTLPDSCVDTEYPGTAPRGDATHPLGSKGVSTMILAETCPWGIVMSSTPNTNRDTES